MRLDRGFHELPRQRPPYCHRRLERQRLLPAVRTRAGVPCMDVRGRLVLPQGEQAPRRADEGARRPLHVRAANTSQPVHLDELGRSRAVPVLLCPHAAIQLRRAAAVVPVPARHQPLRVRRVCGLQQLDARGGTRARDPHRGQQPRVHQGGRVQDGAEHRHLPGGLGPGGGRRAVPVPRLDGEGGPRRRLPAAAAPEGAPAAGRRWPHVREQLRVGPARAAGGPLPRGDGHLRSAHGQVRGRAGGGDAVAASPLEAQHPPLRGRRQGAHLW
mmetsp:Transcript_71857/g.202879  ORF Transcript_71857/g.202879 Transcript_71857/m.202879 type:complete len:271 (+) Transcript_71857:519-1331(+)